MKKGKANHELSIGIITKVIVFKDCMQGLDGTFSTAIGTSVSIAASS
jgi:hypothetical protein